MIEIEEKRLWLRPTHGAYAMEQYRTEMRWENQRLMGLLYPAKEWDSDVPYPRLATMVEYTGLWSADKAEQAALKERLELIARARFNGRFRDD